VPKKAAGKKKGWFAQRLASPVERPVICHCCQKVCVQYIPLIAVVKEFLRKIVYGHNFFVYLDRCDLEEA